LLALPFGSRSCLLQDELLQGQIRDRSTKPLVLGLRERRRHVLPVFATRNLSAYADAIARRATAFSEAIAAGEPEPVFDVDVAMGHFMLDVALTTMFGAVPDHAVLDEIGIAVRTLSEIAYREATTQIVLPDGLPTPAKRRKRWAMDTFGRFVRDLVVARLADGASAGIDLLGTLLPVEKISPMRSATMSLAFSSPAMRLRPRL
jgi:cytochrome P450